VVTAEGRLPQAQSGGVPNFHFPDACAGVLARAAERREWLSRPLGTRSRYDDMDAAGARESVEARLNTGADGWLTTPEAQELLATHGIPFVTSRFCSEAEQAVAAAGSRAAPSSSKPTSRPRATRAMWMPCCSGLDGSAAIQTGWQELERRVQAAGREWRGAVVQPLVSGGADVLLGAISDPELGPVMALGLGGRQAGLAGNVAFRLVPVTDVDADELLRASRSVALQLNGFRGGPVLDSARCASSSSASRPCCARCPRSWKPI
jgi:acyl-CoA synthetase (NDP forming)